MPMYSTTIADAHDVCACREAATTACNSQHPTAPLCGSLGSPSCPPGAPWMCQPAAGCRIACAHGPSPGTQEHEIHRCRLPPPWLHGRLDSWLTCRDLVFLTRAHGASDRLYTQPARTCHFPGLHQTPRHHLRTPHTLPDLPPPPLWPLCNNATTVSPEAASPLSTANPTAKQIKPNLQHETRP